MKTQLLDWLRAVRLWPFCTLILILATVIPGFAQEPSWQRLINSDKEPQNWLSYGGNYAAHRFSSLNQITPANVNNLAPAWLFPTGEVRGGLNATPIVMDGVMYLMGPMNRVFAMNAATGELLWKYIYKLTTKNIPYQVGARGLAIGYGKVYFGTVDNHFIALDMKTGRELWDVEIENTELCGCNVTSPPLVVKDKVIVGGTGGEHAHRGYLSAFDASSGKLLWRFYTIPAAGEPGSETWDPRMLKYGGAPTWLTGSYDAELNLVYWGVGNPSSDFYDEFRPGDNLYSNSIIALDPDTGKLKWHYQEVPHDMYDFDSAYECVLVDYQKDGKTQKLLVHPNKGGYTWVLDRATGKYISAYPHVDNVTWLKGVDKNGRPVDMQPVVPGKETFVCPSAGGGRNWDHSSYSPRTMWWYNVGWEMCNSISPQKMDIVEGKPLFGGGMEFKPPKDKPAYGHINAFDPMTGERKWRYMTDGLNVASLLTTGGGLLFSGDVYGNAFALDAKTGKKLWSFKVGGSVTGSPISYSVNGRQFVAIPVGMGSLVGGLSAQMWPDKMMPEGSSTLVVFALPETKGAASRAK